MDAKSVFAGSCMGGLVFGLALTLYVGQPVPTFNGVTGTAALNQIVARSGAANIRAGMAAEDRQPFASN